MEIVYDPRIGRARETGRAAVRLLTALLWYTFAIGIAWYALGTDGLRHGLALLRQQAVEEQVFEIARRVLEPPFAAALFGPSTAPTCTSKSA